jgi:putative two-component system response regulator
MLSRDKTNKNIFHFKHIMHKQEKRIVLLGQVDKEGKELTQEISLNDTYQPCSRSWYVQSKKNLHSIWTSPYIFFSSKKQGITAASPLLSKEKTFLGSIGVDISTKDLSSFLRTLEFSKKGNMVIFDTQQNIIATNVEKKFLTEKNKLTSIQDFNSTTFNALIQKLTKKKSLKQLENKTFLTLQTPHEMYHAIFSPIKIENTTWIVGIYLCEASYLGEIQRTQKINIYISLSIGIILLMIGYPIAKSISRPIQKMQTLANELQLNHLDMPRLPPSILKEIDESSKAFHDLKNEIIKFDQENRKLNQDLHKASLDTLYRLAIAAEYKDTDTAEHIRRISEYSKILAKELGLNNDEIYIIEHASIMHDVGKLGIADKILLKPAKLTNEEMEVMKTHSLIGAKILEDPSSPIMAAAREIALYHHEKYDGSGYPYGLKGKNIPLMARIVAVVDVFDALVSKRCYKDAFTFEHAITILQEGKGKHFDPKCIEAFEKNISTMLAIYKMHSQED